MKGRIISISLSVILALSVAFIGCGGDEAPEVSGYTLTVSATEGGAVTTPGEATSAYEEGIVVDLAAEAEQGYLFVNWAGDVDTIANINAAETSITMLGDCEVTAKFMAVAGSKTEAVTDDIVDARAEADTEVLVSGNAVVTVARFTDNPGGEPPSGFSLLGKYIDVCVPDVDEVTEIEIRLYYTPSEVPAGIDEGSLKLFWWNGIAWESCDPSGVNTIDCYIWAQIRADGSTPTLAQLTGTPVDGGTSPVTLTLSSTTGGHITQPSSGEGTYRYSQGREVSIRAGAEECYAFVGWSGDVDTVLDVNDASTTIMMWGNYSVTANFYRPSFCEDRPTLVTSSTSGGSVVIPLLPANCYSEGEVVTIKAEADECYRFVEWSGDVDTVVNAYAAQTTIRMQGCQHVTANFAATEVTFADPNLEGAVRDAIGLDQEEGAIYPSDLDELTGLDARGRNIVDLTGLACATSLRVLYLDDNQISDITPLANLTELTSLRLTSNQISNITALANLNSPGLLYLRLDDNQISDVSPLANLSSVAHLRLSSNQISDITPLANLTNLELLYLDSNQISNITALANLTILGALWLDHNQIRDISPLASLTSLGALHLDDNRISDLGPLTGLTNLVDLWLSDNQIDDIRPLANLRNLIGLRLGGNRISDIWDLAGLTRLIELHLEHNEISDIYPLVRNEGLSGEFGGDSVYLRQNPLNSDSICNHIPTLEARGVTVIFDEVYFDDPNLEAAVREAIGKDPEEGPIYLSDLCELTYLDASGRGITSLNGLEWATSLTRLILYDNSLADIYPLTFLTNLTHLELSRNNIMDISPLAGLTNLTYLAIRYNYVEWLAPLANLTSLTELWLGWNVLTDTWGLDNLTSLTTLDLNGNQISNLSYLAGLTNLTELGLAFNDRISDISYLDGLTGLTLLQLTGNRISNIAPLSDLTGLTLLQLGDNRISDISPLANLTSMSTLILEDNDVTGIYALLQNQGLGGGDEVWLAGNPLDDYCRETQIPELEAKGVIVHY